MCAGRTREKLHKTATGLQQVGWRGFETIRRGDKTKGTNNKTELVSPDDRVGKYILYTTIMRTNTNFHGKPMRDAEPKKKKNSRLTVAIRGFWFFAPSLMSYTRSQKKVRPSLAVDFGDELAKKKKKTDRLYIPKIAVYRRVTSNGKRDRPQNYTPRTSRRVLIQSEIAAGRGSTY